MSERLTRGTRNQAARTVPPRARTPPQMPQAGIRIRSYPALSGFGLLVCLQAVCGCGIVGEWELERVAGATSPFSHEGTRITFRDDGTYSTQTAYDGRTTINRGRYTWNHRALVVTPYARQSRTYRGRRWFDRLVLSTRYEGAPVRCYFHRVTDADEPSTSAPGAKDTIRDAPPRSGAEE
jgi:hypothetical protein